MKYLPALLLTLALAACSTTERTTAGKPPGVRRIAIHHSGAAGTSQGSSMGAELGGRALKRGVSAALGAAKLGWAGDIIDLAGGMKPSKKKQAGLSQTFRQQCLLSGVDPGPILSQSLARSVAKSRAFTLDSAAPEATVVVILTAADMAAPAGDSIGISALPVITVTARMVDAKGKTIRECTASGTGRPHPWREYGARPALFRAEFTAAANTAAASLAAQLAGSR